MATSASGGESFPDPLLKKVTLEAPETRSGYFNFPPLRLKLDVDVVPIRRLFSCRGVGDASMWGSIDEGFETAVCEMKSL